VHPKSGLIREAVFGVRGVIQGMTSGRRYLIRGVVFDRNGLITEEMHYIIFYCDIL
jgi:hypothetical protein